MWLRALKSSDSMKRAELSYVNFYIPFMIILYMAIQGR